MTEEEHTFLYTPDLIYFIKGLLLSNDQDIVPVFAVIWREKGGGQQDPVCLLNLIQMVKEGEVS